MAGSPRCCYLQQAKFAPIKSALAFTSLIISLPNVVVNLPQQTQNFFGVIKQVLILQSYLSTCLGRCYSINNQLKKQSNQPLGYLMQQQMLPQQTHNFFGYSGKSSYIEELSFYLLRTMLFNVVSMLIQLAQNPMYFFVYIWSSLSTF